MCNKCNKSSYNNCCEPKCDPCLKQQKIMYCGRDIECLDINRGEDLNKTIKKIADWVCTQINTPRADTYVNLVEVEPGELCETGGVTIQLIEFSTDNLVEEYTICNPVPFELLTELNGNILGETTTLNIEEGEGVRIEADNIDGETTYKFSTYFEVTYTEAADLITNELLVKGGTYLITDRDITVRALNEKEFEPNATLVHPCPKTILYFRTGDNLGVYDVYIPTASLTDKIVVYGGKVWKNRTGSRGSAVGLLEMSSPDWELIPITDLDYYELKTLDVLYDFTPDFISEYKDTNGNTVTTNLADATTNGLSNSRYVCDWNAPNLINNQIKVVCLNNAGVVVSGVVYIPANISHNNNSAIVNNSCTVIKNNYVGIISTNLSLEISSNKVTDTISENTVHKITENVVSLSIIGNVASEILKSTVTISNNFVTGSITNNTSLQPITGNRCSEGILNNINTTITNNIATRGIANNTDCTFNRNYLGDSIGNTSLSISYCKIAGNCNNNNTCANITYNITNSFENNTNVFKMHYNIAEYISDNSDIQEASYNVCQRGIEGNKNIQFILENRCRGIIDNDATTYTGTEISRNTNSGYIVRNLFTDNGVKIEYNNNNGEIGSQVVDTNRPANVMGSITNL